MRLTLFLYAYPNQSLTRRRATGDFISALHLQFGDQIDGETLRQTVVPITQQNPLLSFFC